LSCFVNVERWASAAPCTARNGAATELNVGQHLFKVRNKRLTLFVTTNMRILVIGFAGLVVLAAEVVSRRYFYISIVRDRRPWVVGGFLVAIMVALLLPYSLADTFYLASSDFGVYGIPFPSVFLQKEHDMWLDYFGPLTQPSYYMNRVVLALSPQIIVAAAFW